MLFVPAQKVSGIELTYGLKIVIPLDTVFSY